MVRYHGCEKIERYVFHALVMLKSEHCIQSTDCFYSCVCLQCMEHGFPSKASAITYDPELDLMALGSRSGVLRMYV